MFSLLMAGNDEEWAVPVGEVHRDTFTLSRFLEYTDPVIEARFKPVSDDTLRVLADHPALFMSELRGDRDHALGDHVRMRVGRLLELAVVGRTIAYTFVIDEDLGAVPVADRAAFEEVLDLGKWELTRTHWAVKDGDLPGAIAALDLAPPAPAAPPAMEAAGDEGPLVADSLESFLQIILRHDGDKESEVFYRGHGRQQYRLEPSLFRKNDKGGFRYLPNEAYLVNELLTAQPADFAADTHMIDKLVRMQHYGLPTRLLDVTSNPLVALYFCCSGVAYDDAGAEIDGHVIALTTKRSDIKFFNSDKVSCIANLALLEDRHKNAMDLTLGTQAFNETEAAERLLHIIGAEKPYFKPRIVPDDLRDIVFVKGRNSNTRISSQAGAFLLFGHDALLPETGHSSLDITRIVIREKAHILTQLARMNIRSSTIYPGIDKTAAEIAKQHENLD